MKHLQVKTVKHHNFATEKTALYLVIGEGENKVIVNIGQNTFDKIRKLTEEKEENPDQLTIDESWKEETPQETAKS